MRFDEYQERAKKYDFFEKTDDFGAVGFCEKVLGLVGEAGETADKIKKNLRDKGGKADASDKEEIAKELGDVLWYLASISRYLDMPLSQVAQANIDKLESRRRRNRLHGEGDNR